MRFEDGFKVQGSKFGVQGSEFRVQSSGFRVEGFVEGREAEGGRGKEVCLRLAGTLAPPASKGEQRTSNAKRPTANVALPAKFAAGPEAGAPLPGGYPEICFGKQYMSARLDLILEGLADKVVRAPAVAGQAGGTVSRHG